MKKVKYYYLFKPDLGSHIQFYAGWVNAARRNGLPIRMISFVNTKNYYKNQKIARKSKQENDAIIIPVPFFLRNFTVLLYFIFSSFTCDEIIIHLKKVNPNMFDLIKIFNRKIKCVVDLEGDPESEIDYLVNHPYKKGFYDQIIKNLEHQIQNHEDVLMKSDYIFTVTDKLRDRMIMRYPQISKKIGVLPTGVDNNKFFFDMKIRSEKRKALDIEGKFVMIFTGNVYYSWQNLKRTLETFKLIKSIKSNAYMILLIKESDLWIAEEFIEQVCISKNDIFLGSVSNEEVNGFLNAADLGVLLRNNHIMNQVASPGKIGEYAISGLPILSTKSSSNYYEELQETGQMIIIDNLKDDKEILKKISDYDFNEVNRVNYHNYSEKLFSNESYIGFYIKTLRSL